MKAKKVLYVVSRPLQINTSASIRNKAMILGLVDNGFHVDLLTTSPDSNHMAYDASMDITEVRCQYITLGGIHNVARIGRKMKSLRPFFYSLINIFRKQSVYDSFVNIINHTNLVNLKENEYEFIISSSDPKSSHLFVEKLLRGQGKHFHGKWIQIWGDPFYDDITLPKTIDKQVVYKEEARLLDCADKIIYVSMLTLQKQKARFRSASFKMDYQPIPYIKEIISDNRRLSDAKNISIAYCGDYSSQVRNIIPLYETIKGLDNTILTIYGNSDLKLQDTEKITVKPRQGISAVEELELNCDILVHLSNLSGSQIPGKIYQYSGTNKPILFILDGDSDSVKNIFSKYNRYVFSENKVEAIRKAIENIILENKNFMPIKEFSRKYVVKNLITEI